jgi:hypothetical protein
VAAGSRRGGVGGWKKASGASQPRRDLLCQQLLCLPQQQRSHQQTTVVCMRACGPAPPPPPRGPSPSAKATLQMPPATYLALCDVPSTGRVMSHQSGIVAVAAAAWPSGGKVLGRGPCARTWSGHFTCWVVVELESLVAAGAKSKSSSSSYSWGRDLEEAAPQHQSTKTTQFPEWLVTRCIPARCSRVSETCSLRERDAQRGRAAPRVAELHVRM